MRLKLAAFVARLPRRTVRLRLTLTYGGLFLASGAALLAITYVLVVHATSGFTFTGQNGSVASVSSPGKSAAPRAQEPTNLTQNGTLPGLTPEQARASVEQLQAQAAQQREAQLHQLVTQSGIALAIMAVVSIALGWIIAGRMLRKLRTITTAVREISATNLHDRLVLSGPNDEIKELGDTFDGLLARLEASFQAQRRFVANASHELRTPLTRQRALAQVALADPDPTVTSLRTAHERILTSGAQQERLIDSLLTLARGQVGPGDYQPFDLADLTYDALSVRRPAAEARQLSLDTRLRPATASGDRQLVERLITNLIDNAIRHNTPAGSIVVTTDTRAGAAVLSVTNSGPVIPPEEIDRLFEPFQRLGTDRTHHTEGHGLGLSIVQAIADTHNATITTKTPPDGGLEIEVSFPAGDAAPPDSPPAGARRTRLALR
ncbi:sensor histidine kinase [Kribbella sp. NPDC004536]|uniref:sensor histidine kinase n=1 Tax=Kribbella sp. NPDC004536 TaxID=3364106 RepID=UPI00367AEF45